MSNYKNKTIAYKIHKSTSSLTIVMLFIFFIVVSLISSIFFYKNTINFANQNIEIITKNFNLLTESIKNKIITVIVSDELQENLDNYYKNENTFEAKLNISKYLTKEMSYTMGVTGVDLVLTNFTEINTGNFFSYKDDDILFRKISKDNSYKPYRWLGPYKRKNNKGDIEEVFIIEKKVIDLYKYKEIAMLYVYVSESISDILYQNARYDNIEFILVSDNGSILLSQNEKEIKKNYNNHNILKDKQNYIDLVGMKFLFKNSLSIDNIYLVAEIPIISLISTQIIFIFIFIICSLTTIVLSLSISKKNANTILEPITTFANAMNNATLGNRKLRVNEETMDEFEILNKSFNTLMDSNEDLLVKIQEKHRNLRNYKYRIFQEQLKPHFIYNALSNISSLIKLDMKDVAISIIENLSKFLRLSLSGINDIISIKEELEIISSYIKIQQQRFKDKITVQYFIDDNILNNEIPKLTLQPIIENAICHGMNNCPIKIEIKSYLTKNKVYIKIKDNGTGINTNTLDDIIKNINNKNSKNLGLTIVNQRLILTYGNKYKLKITSEVKKYTEVIICLPYKNI